MQSQRRAVHTKTLRTDAVRDQMTSDTSTDRIRKEHALLNFVLLYVALSTNYTGQSLLLGVEYAKMFWVHTDINKILWALRKSVQY